jgi:glycosyltransferase involved in cell wall biosynthesis
MASEAISQALVSVIIPAFNSEVSIGAQLTSLQNQDMEEPFEIIVVDDKSTDRTAQIVRDFASIDSRICLLLLDENGGSYAARNEGARRARGAILVFCDADDTVDHGFLAAMVQSLDDADIVGASLDVEGPGLVGYFGAAGELPRVMDYLPVALTAGLATRAALFWQLGGMDASLRSGADADFCWRAQLSRHSIRRAASARVKYRVRSGYRARAWQFYKYGLAHPELYRRFRSQGLPRRSWRSVLKDWMIVVIGAPCLPFLDRDLRLVWCSRAGETIGAVVGSVRTRVLWL